MASIDTYSQDIQTLLTTLSHQLKTDDGIEIQLLFDQEHHHYQLLEVGWEKHDRIYNGILHLDIKDGKVWIQRNMTDIYIADELVKMGVPKSDIVLGLQAPYKRPYTDYGVA